MNAQCRECMKRRPHTFTATHKGGGSYRRPNRRYWSTICLGCVRRLAEHATPGHSTISGWDASALRRLAEANAEVEL